MARRWQLDYRSDTRPIVLNCLEHYSAENAEVIPTIVSAMPELRAVNHADEETESHQLPVLRVGRMEKELHSLVHFLMFWIEHNTRSISDSDTSNYRQLQFIYEVKPIWARQITTAGFSAPRRAIREGFLTSIAPIFEHLSGESLRHVYSKFKDWQKLHLQVTDSLEMLDQSVNFQLEAGLGSLSLLSEAQRNDVRQIAKFALRSSFSLAMLTETEERSTEIVAKLTADMDELLQAFYNGHIIAPFFVSLLRMMYQATCPAAASLDILEEARKEITIISREEMVENCCKNLCEDDIEKMDEGEACCVCLSEFEAGEEVCETPCSHTLHKSCLEQTLEERNRCPLCRAEVYEIPGLWISL